MISVSNYYLESQTFSKIIKMINRTNGMVGLYVIKKHTLNNSYFYTHRFISLT